MWWIIALAGMLTAVVCFGGVLVCMLRFNRQWMKRFIIGFMISFAVAFVSVGLAGRV